ncbi:replication/maintenance protein RepL [Colwellia sp. MEBiC06753]
MSTTIESKTITTRIDRETGEFIESVEKEARVIRKKVKIQYAMFFGHISALKGLTANQLLVLLALSCEIEFDTGEIDISTARRKSLAKDLGLSLATLRNIISQLVKYGHIRKLDSGMFQLSPLLFYRGKLKQLESQREQFNKQAA